MSEGVYRLRPPQSRRRRFIGTAGILAAAASSPSRRRQPASTLYARSRWLPQGPRRVIFARPTGSSLAPLPVRPVLRQRRALAPLLYRRRFVGTAVVVVAAASLPARRRPVRPTIYPRSLLPRRRRFIGTAVVVITMHSLPVRRRNPGQWPREAPRSIMRAWIGTAVVGVVVPLPPFYSRQTGVLGRQTSGRGGSATRSPVLTSASRGRMSSA